MTEHPPVGRTASCVHAGRDSCTYKKVADPRMGHLTTLASRLTLAASWLQRDAPRNYIPGSRQVAEQKKHPENDTDNPTSPTAPEQIQKKQTPVMVFLNSQLLS